MKIICIGRNYKLHAQELNNEVPENPVFFMKPDTALLLKNRPFFHPDFSQNIHYEVELVVVINRLGKHIEKKFAHSYYDEIALGIDFTARDIQKQLKQKGLPWEQAKGFDSSAALSPKMSKKQFESIDNIPFHLDINGQTVQTGNTKDMLFAVDDLIVYLSQFMTLKIGDLIYTGTPAGVGKVNINDRLEGYIGKEKMLDFYIK